MLSMSLKSVPGFSYYKIQRHWIQSTVNILTYFVFCLVFVGLHCSPLFCLTQSHQYLTHYLPCPLLVVAANRSDTRPLLLFLYMDTTHTLIYNSMRLVLLTSRLAILNQIDDSKNGINVINPNTLYLQY